MNAHVRPSYITETVRNHRQKMQADLERLEATASAAVLAVALKERGAEKRLAEIREKIADAEFQLRYMPGAVEQAHARDDTSTKDWLAARFDLPGTELLDGLNREECPRRCLNGVFGGCVLGGGCSDAGGRCLHPVREAYNFAASDEADLTSLKQKLIFPLSHHEKAIEIFRAACSKLGLEERFKWPTK